jgi:hypothetical protein
MLEGVSLVLCLVRQGDARLSIFISPLLLGPLYLFGAIFGTVDSGFGFPLVGAFWRNRIWLMR